MGKRLKTAPNFGADYQQNGHRAELLSAQQIATKVQIGLQSVYRLMDTGALPTLCVGRNRYVAREAFDTWWQGLAKVPTQLAPPSRSRLVPDFPVRVKTRTTDSILISAPEFARISGLGYSYTRKLLNSGQIPVREIEGRKWIIRKSAIKWLEGEEETE